VAVLEDIALWAVLAIATSLARSSARGSGGILQHVLGTLIFLGLGLTITPVLLKRLHQARWNILAVASPVGYLFALLFGFTAIAAVFDVNIVFAAFLAGFGVASEDRQFGDAMDSLGRVSFSVFVPVYFVLVGYKLDLGKSFSFSMLLTFILGACLLKIVSVGVGAKLAGFKGLDVLNLAVATNARGGPGIVLASVAYEAGIINAAFYTTLVLLAIITSQAAGAWLEYVLRKGWPLLGFHVSSELRPDQANDIPTAT
jgi:Kef-type K+ transport system membrane component KefB